MLTDKELRKKKYKTEYQRLRVNILYTANWLNAQVRTFLKPYDITPKQFNILRILRGNKNKTSLSILEIKQKMIDHMSDVSRLIDRLEKKHLLEKTNCDHDKRSMRIQISKEGLQLLKKIDLEMHVLDDIFMNINEDVALQLNEGLNAFRVVK